MTMLAGIASWLVAAPVLLVNGVLATELALGLPPPRRKPDPAGPAPRTVILMPAHNEAGGIAGIIDALKPMLSDTLRLLVVADNCSDDTATVARAAGAQVVERHDASARGKGHALAFGRDHLRAEAPDCVIVLDADCVVDPGTLERLSRAARASGRPVQGCILLRPSAHDAPMVQISNFAFLIKNKVRQRGARRLGAPANLGGTGMAMPWALFEGAPLATSDLVEDLALGIHFTRAGRPPLFLEGASGWTDPADAADTLTQRTRWEHGFIGTALRKAPWLLGAGLASGRPGMIWTGLHLMVPPLALLVSLTGLATIICMLLAFTGAGWSAAGACGAALGTIALLLAFNWWWNGRGTVRGETLLRVPLYLLWKLPVYLRLAGRRESQWVRTKRAGEE